MRYEQLLGIEGQNHVGPSQVHFLVQNNIGIPLDDGKHVDISVGSPVLDDYARTQVVESRFEELTVPLDLIAPKKPFFMPQFYSGIQSQDQGALMWLSVPAIYKEVLKNNSVDKGAALSAGLAYEFVRQCAVLSIYLDEITYVQVQHRSIGYIFSGAAGALALNSTIVLAEMTLGSAGEDAFELSRRNAIKLLIASVVGFGGGSILYGNYNDVALAQKKAVSHIATIAELSAQFQVSIY